MAPQPEANPQPQDPPPRRPSEVNGPQSEDHHNVWGWIILAVLLVLIAAGAGWIIYARIRARRLGLPPPQLNPFSDSNRVPDSGYPGRARGGFVSWAQEKWRALRNKRTAGGAYEGTALDSSEGTRTGRRNFGRLDPDEAWDARVGNEADGYHEEQELGLHEPASGPGGAYGGSGYGRRGYAPSRGLSEIETGVTTEDTDDRGRRRSRNELDERYQQQAVGNISNAARDNPFGDDNVAPSLRGISPRPHIDDEDTSYRGAQADHQRNKSSINSATERKSLFREEM